MTTQKELHDAVAHIGAVTGDPLAWKTGLTPQDAAVVGLVVAPPAELTAVLDKIKANHPALFDPRSGTLVVPADSPLPAPPAEEQRGAGVTAIKKAEGDLAHQNSSTAQLDLLVVSAILNAHTTTESGGAELRGLQAEIEDAVRTRTDLDTPAGARDFQRYLISKLREIGAVVQTASLDDSSKAVLATAWTALYEASKYPTTSNAAHDEPAAPTLSSGLSTPPAASATVPLPPYGADLETDPLLEQLLAQDPLNTAGAPSQTAPAGGSAAPVLPAMPGLPQTGMPAGGGGLPGTGAPAAAGGWPKIDEPVASGPRDDPGALTLEELLAGTDPADPVDPLGPEALAQDGEDPADENGDAETGDIEPKPDPTPVPESTHVRLPDGDVVVAPTPQLAKILTAAIGGTPIGEAFHQHGLPIPPPGTAVSHPVDPAVVGTGDVGMFTDRQALALDRTRALLSGEIQPLASVSGPSFLGWLHPPQPGAMAPTAAADPPAQTRPSTTIAPGS